MLKVWYKFLPLSCGVLMSLISTVFIIQFVRTIHFQTMPFLLEIPSESWFSLIVAFVVGTIGVPLAVTGIKSIEKNDI